MLANKHLPTVALPVAPPAFTIIDGDPVNDGITVDAHTNVSANASTDTPNDALISASVLDVIATVTRERAEKLDSGASIREVNEDYVREYSRYLASITKEDEHVIYRQVATSLARSGKEASATLLQLVVGARVYQSLGMTPSAGVFGDGVYT
ncbi:MAG: hypothetical protein ACR2M1_15115 [Gemmatimonadaceae bacterium]